MGKIREIVFDCDAAPALARFWAEILDGYSVRAYDQAEIDRLAKLGLTPETDPTVLVDGPGPMLCFQQVPHRDTTTTGCTSTSRLPIDNRKLEESERSVENSSAKHQNTP